MACFSSFQSLQFCKILIVTENLIPVRELRSSNTFNPILYLDTGDVKISSLILSTLSQSWTVTQLQLNKTHIRHSEWSPLLTYLQFVSDICFAQNIITLQNRKKNGIHLFTSSTTDTGKRLKSNKENKCLYLYWIPNMKSIVVGYAVHFR